MANISIYDPRTMGKLVERMPKVQTFIKSTFFRNVETFDTQKIDVDFKKGNRQLAPFVHKKIGGVTIDNEGYETNTYEPPLVAPNKITTVTQPVGKDYKLRIYEFWITARERAGRSGGIGQVR